MSSKIVARLAFALMLATAALPQPAASMDRAAYAQMAMEDKAFIAKLEKLPAEVRTCLLAEQYSVVPTDSNNHAKKPVKINLPGGKQADFEKVVGDARGKYNWAAIWDELYKQRLGAVGKVYADDIAKLRKLNSAHAKHAQDIVAKFRKVDVRALDAFFTEMYEWSERKGNGTNEDSKIYGSDHRQYRWGDLFKRVDSQTWEALKPLWRGNKGLLEMEFGTQISKLRQYNSKEVAKREKAAEKKGKGDRKVEKPATSLSPKALSAAVSSVQGLLKQMPDAARVAFLSALADDATTENLLESSYTDAKGRSRSVYDELQAASAVKPALQAMQKAQEDAAVRSEVLSRNTKALKGAEKGKELRDNRRVALQKVFDARLAEREVERMEYAGTDDLPAVLETTRELVQKVPDPMAQEVLMGSVAHKYTVEDLFTKEVYDDKGNARNCYDVLKDADMVETAVLLMLNAHSCAKLPAEAAKLNADREAAREKQKQKRAARIKAALKAHEAEEAQRALEKAEKK